MYLYCDATTSALTSLYNTNHNPLNKCLSVTRVSFFHNFFNVGVVFIRFESVKMFHLKKSRED